MPWPDLLTVAITVKQLFWTYLEALSLGRSKAAMPELFSGSVLSVWARWYSVSPLLSEHQGPGQKTDGCFFYLAHPIQHLKTFLEDSIIIIHIDTSKSLKYVNFCHPRAAVATAAILECQCQPISSLVVQHNSAIP